MIIVIIRRARSSKKIEETFEKAEVISNDQVVESLKSDLRMIIMSSVTVLMFVVTFKSNFNEIFTVKTYQVLGIGFVSSIISSFLSIKYGIDFLNNIFYKISFLSFVISMGILIVVFYGLNTSTWVSFFWSFL